MASDVFVMAPATEMEVEVEPQGALAVQGQPGSLGGSKPRALVALERMTRWSSYTPGRFAAHHSGNVRMPPGGVVPAEVYIFFIFIYKNRRKRTVTERENLCSP